MRPGPALRAGFLAAAASVAGCAMPGLGTFSLYDENDFYNLGSPTDGHYTHGTRVSWVYEPKETPELALAIASTLPTYRAETTTAVGVIVGQSFFTPDNIRRDDLIVNDRPYAGWLYAGVLVANAVRAGDDRGGDDLETLELDVGIVGPYSFAEPTQKLVHEVVNSPDPKGWEHQLHNEVGIVLTYERRLRVLAGGDPEKMSWDGLAGVVGTAGNVYTHGGASLALRWGYNLPRDFGVGTIQTTAVEIDDDGEDNLPSLYFFVGGHGRGVVRNIFLDGNTFRDSHSVDKRHWITEGSFGVAFEWCGLRLAWTQVYRSPEFEQQRGWQGFGSLSFSYGMAF